MSDERTTWLTVPVGLALMVGITVAGSGLLMVVYSVVTELTH